MTSKTLEERAREIVITLNGSTFSDNQGFIEKAERMILAFALSVRNEEREACAKIAETLKTLNAWLPTNDDGTGESEHTTIHGEKIAAAIRSQD